MKLRLFLLPVLVATLIAPATAAPLTGYTAADQRMFDKLGATVGTWRCVDTPASKKPDVLTITREGQYFVGRETGDNPSTTYTRWSHTFQRYFSNSVSSNGAMSVMQTLSKDPNNATWTYAFPTSLPKGELYPFTATMTGHTWSSSGKYLDDKGKIQTATSVCTKQ